MLHGMRFKGKDDLQLYPLLGVIHIAQGEDRRVENGNVGRVYTFTRVN
jgi:hypothetical protein